MAIKYKVFSEWDAEECVVPKTNWLGVPHATHTTTVERRRYTNSQQLYDAVAAFASSVGDRLVTISHPIKMGCEHTQDFIVWYREAE